MGTIRNRGIGSFQKEVARVIHGPQRASLDDFDSIVELANTCFTGDRDRGGMLARWPHCYIREPDFMKNCLIMKDGSRVISLVEYVDQTLLVATCLSLPAREIRGIRYWDN